MEGSTLNGYYIPDIVVNFYRNCSTGMATEQKVKHTGKKDKKNILQEKATLKLKTKSV